MKYQAQCPTCKHEKEYESPITDPERDLPNCPYCWVGAVGEGDPQPTKMLKVFVGNAGGFILKGPNWAKKGKAGY